MEKLNIDTIKQLIKDEKIRWTNHVMVRLLQRNITQSDVEKALLNGELKNMKMIIHTQAV